MAAAWVRAGKIRSVNPARRELRLTPTREVAGASANIAGARVILADGATVACKVEHVNATPDGWILTLGAGAPRDTVAAMKNAALEVMLPKRKRSVPDELTAEDWIGLNVVGADGARIGVIRGCIESRAHDILEIKRPDGQEFLLPAVEQTIESIDLETGQVTVGDMRPYVIDHAD